MEKGGWGGLLPFYCVSQNCHLYEGIRVSWMRREGPKVCKERIRANAECNGRLISSGPSHLSCQSSQIFC
jgi:hypothetical protein